MNACLPETDSPRLTLAMSFVGRTYLIIAITCSSFLGVGGSSLLHASLSHDLGTQQNGIGCRKM